MVNMGNSVILKKKTNYSKLLSSLFCSSSIIFLSILCLLNNLSFDFYSACILLKVVVPASCCFWFLGYAMGKILTKSGKGGGSIKEFELSNDNEAYTIPSMFAADETPSDEMIEEEL